VQTIDRELVRDAIIELGGVARLTRTALIVDGPSSVLFELVALGVKLFKDIK
jgi:hypothetical protein